MGLLVILILLVVLFLVVRVKKNDDNLPVSATDPAVVGALDEHRPR